MNGTGPRQGNFVGNMSVNNPTTGDTLIFNASGQWENTPATSVGTTVHSDGTTIQGDGSVGDPLSVIPGTSTVQTDGVTLQGNGVSPVLSLKRVYSDLDTVEGDGVSATPIKLRKVYHDGTMSGLGTSASPLSVASSTVAVTTDGDTIEGDGTLLTPIELKKVYVNTTLNLTGLGTAASPIYWTGNYVGASMSGNGTQVSPLNTATGRTAIITETTDFDGDGTIGSTLTLKDRPSVTTGVVYGGMTVFNSHGICVNAATLDSTFTASYRQVQTINNNTTTTILANSLQAGFPNNTPAALNTATGEYTTPAAGTYAVDFSAKWATNATGFRFAYFEAEESGGGVYRTIAEDIVSSCSASVEERNNVSFKVVMANNRKIRFKVSQTSGGNLSCTFSASITLLHN
jgi:hypothetical protein